MPSFVIQPSASCCSNEQLGGNTVLPVAGWGSFTLLMPASCSACPAFLTRLMRSSMLVMNADYITARAKARQQPHLPARAQRRAARHHRARPAIAAITGGFVVELVFSHRPRPRLRGSGAAARTR